MNELSLVHFLHDSVNGSGATLCFVCWHSNSSEINFGVEMVIQKLIDHVSIKELLDQICFHLVANIAHHIFQIYFVQGT